MFFYFPKFTVFSEIGNNPMRALGRKNICFFFGNALPKSNARAHLKQRKKHSDLNSVTMLTHVIHRPTFALLLKIFQLFLKRSEMFKQFKSLCGIHANGAEHHLIKSTVQSIRRLSDIEQIVCEFVT